MEDAWRAKCSSAWNPQPPAPPAAEAPASSSANQINVNPPQNFRPFVVQGATVENRPAVQEPLVFHTLNLDFSKSGKNELNNSFLALLSANPHNLPGEFSQLAKLHSRTDGVIVSSASPSAQVTSIPSLSQINTSSSMWNAKNPSFVEPRPSLIPTNNKGQASHNNLHAATSHCQASASSKQVRDQAFQCASAGKPTLSCSWPSNSRPQNTNQHRPSSFQNSQRVRTEAGSTIPSHVSARSSGRPRVICMNTVGELFLSELGLLGVICFCHGIRMSVANFCEHSGSSANPGEVIRLENGMTVAQWRKLCFGNNAPDDCKGWDWSDGPSKKLGFIGSRGSTLPILPQNLGTVDSNQKFAGLEKVGDPWNRSYHAKLPFTGVRQADIKHPMKMVSDNMYQRNKLEGVGFTSSLQIHVPVLAKNNTVSAIKESPGCLNPEASHATLNKGQQNIWSRSVIDNDNCKEKLGTPSIIYPHSDSKSRSCQFNRSKNSFGSEVFVTRDGYSSNIDLRLGQPSQVHTLSSLSTAVNSLQFDATSDHQKSLVKFPLPEKSHYPVETKQHNGIWCTSFEPSISNRGQPLHAVGSSKNSNLYEAKELMGSATKNSLISSFLSNLNTKGGTASQVTTIVNDTKYSLPGPISAKCNLSEHINEVNDKTQRNNFLDGSDLSTNIDKGTRLRNHENGSTDTVKVKCMVHDKRTADTRVLMPAVDGQCLYGRSSVDDRRSSFNFNQPSTTLQSRPDSMNFNHYGKLPFGRNGEKCNHATNSFMTPVTHAPPRPGPPNEGIPMNLTSSNSLYVSEMNSAVKHAKSDHTQHLADDGMKLFTLRHMVELSKQEQEHSTATLETSPRHQRLCCLSGAELQSNLCNGDSTASRDLRQGAYCDIHQNTSNSTVRSLQSCSNCLSGNDVEMLSAKPATGDRSEHSKYTTLTERISHCSKGQDISTCHAFCSYEHPCLRRTGLSNFGSGIVKQIFDAKEQSTSFHGKCCCSLLSKHLAGCCFAGHFSPSNSINNEQVCGDVIIKHITGACDEIHRSQDTSNVNLCECSKKHFVMKNDCQIGLWRDVPAKKLGLSDATSVDKPSNVLKTSKRTEDPLPETTSCKGFEGTQVEVDSMNEQQMSNVCSGSSAPAITEISVEVNKINYFATNLEDNETACEFLANEGSGVEKCGSSDEAVANRAANDEADLGKSGSSLPIGTSGDLIDELRKETSSNKKMVRNQMHVDQEHVKRRKVEKAEKRKDQMKMNKLDMSVPKSDLCPLNSKSSHSISHLKWEYPIPANDNIQALSQPEPPMQKLGVKRKRSSLSSTESLSLKTKSHHNILEFDKMHAANDDQSLRTLAVASEKEELTVPTKKQYAKREDIHLGFEKPPKYVSLSHIAKSNNHEMEIVGEMARPVVCGKSGIISNGGLSGKKKPPKIVALSLILKRSKRCDVNDIGAKPKKMLTSESKKMLPKEKDGCCDELSYLNLQFGNDDSERNGRDSTTVHRFGTHNQHTRKSYEHVDEFSMTENEIDNMNEVKPVLHHECKVSQMRPRYREVRKCSLSELLSKNKNTTKLSCEPNHGASGSSTMDETGDQPKASTSTATGNSLIDDGLGKRSLNNQDDAGELSQINSRRSGKVRKCQPSFLGSDTFCSVCGSSVTEEINRILECNRCLIRVHQACYGVSKVPRGHWFCRPCKANSQSIVCVLCGYEGGAMTKAVRSQNIVRSLLKAWNFDAFMRSASSSETGKGESLGLCSVIEASKCDNSGSISATRSACSEAFLEGAVELISENQTSDQMPKGLQLYNSVTAGVFDPSIIQWVHVVCGLWTPGTRCPNVDTMSAFDVFGASAARKSTVCSMCNRPGGCCIQCRVLKCSVHFHPWCAHQKGLLQSEIEGDDNEKVGFYGRCMLHAAQDAADVDCHPGVNTEVGSPKKDWSCARTEGFKGRKSEGGFKHNHQRSPNNDNGGCIVSQEQINAWLHMNGQKSCTRALVRPPCSDVEYDCRKEYLRYKQNKAWKHLVVYKSGIHALGLYTSRLIARGAMVVEYVGEIVGLRVADKREIEYQSGRRLQYKSACYFFRIDKEHIIDATRKGGIARFVNHSCQPNCVAKVISIRNEKKVVFFAERDINPGEEITYDYHFNSEDEGQKIPCYCNSKTCRQYLN